MDLFTSEDEVEGDIGCSVIGGHTEQVELPGTFKDIQDMSTEWRPAPDSKHTAGVAIYLVFGKRSWTSKNDSGLLLAVENILICP